MIDQPHTGPRARRGETSLAKEARVYKRRLVILAAFVLAAAPLLALLWELRLEERVFGFLGWRYDTGFEELFRWHFVLAYFAFAALALTPSFFLMSRMLKWLGLHESELARQVTEGTAEWRLANELLRNQIESSPDAILVVAPDGRMVSFNQRFLDMWSIPPEIAELRDDEAALASVLDQLKEPDRFLAWVKYLYAHPEAAACEDVELKDGRVFERHTAGMHDAAENYLGRVWYFRDVTERRKAAAELEFANELLAAQIENSPDGILVVNADRRIVLFNERFRELWRIPPDVIAAGADEAVLQAGMAQMKDPEAFHARVMHFYDHPDESGNEDIEFKDGRVFDRHTTPLRDSSGKFLGRLWVFHDVTERRHSEERLRQSQKLESVGQLTGGVAHNFNNLLSVIIGNLELLMTRANPGPEAAKYAGLALDGALRGAELTHHLLAFSRKQALQPKTVEVAQQLGKISELLRGTLGAQIAIEVDCAPGLWPVIVDPSQLDNAIVNLALNARDAMPAGGTLKIAAENVPVAAERASPGGDMAPGDYVRISVADSGSGIPAKILERVFEPFFTTKELGKGSGLGLSMVYGFVKQSDGHVEIESDPGRGTAVSIYLPRAGAAQESETAPAHGMAEAPAADALVLVVEDNPDVREIVVHQLKGFGYRTLEADGARAALKILADNPGVDLVFSDVLMPEKMNGYDLAREIRGRHPGMKILLTSGYDMNLMPNAGESEEFPMLQKPYRMHEFAETLREVLRPES